MATAHLLSQLLPLQSVHLGRLVLDASRPSQDFIDPPSSEHTPQQASQNVQTNYTETRRFSKRSKVNSYLADTISFSYGQQNECIATLSAPQATTYDLANSAAWFEAACGEFEVRRFLDRAIDNGCKVYLIVGFRTVSDGRLAKHLAARRNRAQYMPLHFTYRTHIALPSPTTGPVASSVRGNRNGQELGYEAPEEQVFAVLYRKVNFRFLTMTAVDTVVLEANNRWESVWNWRGRNDLASNGDVQVIEATLNNLDNLDVGDEEVSEEVSEEESEDGPYPVEVFGRYPEYEVVYQRNHVRHERNYEEYEVNDEEEETPIQSRMISQITEREIVRRFHRDFWYLWVVFAFFSGGLVTFWVARS